MKFLELFLKKCFGPFGRKQTRFGQTVPRDPTRKKKEKNQLKKREKRFFEKHSSSVGT